MKIELRKLSDSKPYPGNPRQNDAAVDAVAESTRQFGLGRFRPAAPQGRTAEKRPTGLPPGMGGSACGMARPNTAFPRGAFLGKIGEGGHADR